MRVSFDTFGITSIPSSVLPRWTESIAQKVKRKKKVEDNSKKDIWHSVFEPQYIPSGVPTGPVSLIVSVLYVQDPTCTAQCVQVKTLDHGLPMTASNFEG